MPLAKQTSIEEELSHGRDSPMKSPTGSVTRSPRRAMSPDRPASRCAKCYIIKMYIKWNKLTYTLINYLLLLEFKNEGSLWKIAGK